MRKLIPAILAAALLSGCPQEHDDTTSVSSGGNVAARDASSARAGTGRVTAPVPAHGPGAAHGGVVTPQRTGPSDALAAAPLATAARLPTDDANADGRSDLTWYRIRGDRRDIAHWRMNGAAVLQTTGPTEVKLGTNGILNGDFDGDRRVDQTWFNSAAGNRQLTLARQNASGGFELAYVASIGDGWFPSAAEDLNADGKSDLVWLDRARGLIAYWLMSGTTVLGTRLYTVDTNNYDFLGTGDFDGDGRGDLLWLGHRTNGPLYIWRGRADGNFDQLLVGDLSIAFEIQGTPDLNGDGRSDLVFTSYTNRTFSYWMMNGASVQSGGVIPIDRDRYEIAATGDYDGDGKGDIMWTTKSRFETASLYQWRGRGDGSFDSLFVAYYDHGTWQTLNRYE
ncbi:VCBS repeat-containing protein [Lysobacter sp. 5GHs7-4]|uniref:FG-GAP repeat domain-containing protein n=1 Tax=Lysobacter sp. 5GHs7-4 TaxID=2904253 RepID=UPI001E5CD138|nr:VCBS repeat-containing protein [Lysobacter sp. 5GHs7-4]UHQ22679.1 VCBS repeat-containing protein [Lysobacter sp. 5GHs7-4]